MDSVIPLLERAKKAGVTVEIDGDSLRIEADEQHRDLVRELQRRKAEVLRALNPEPSKDELIADDVDDENQGAEPLPKNQATRLVELAHQNGIELWHTLDQEAFATIGNGDHRENVRINTSSFKRWLARLYYLETGNAVGSQARQDAASVLEGEALYDGQQHEAFVRIASYGDNIYLDLANERWEAVEITSHGWRVLTAPPIRFRRDKSMLPLPTPKSGGRVDAIRQFVNVSDDDFRLLVMWLIVSLRPGFPFPALILSAEQGSGKSTTARLLRSLIDPNKASLRCEPRDARDLMIAATNSHIISLDNISAIPVWLSDALCRLSTGGGFSTRKLYENDEEQIFDSMRPVILNGIEEIATRSDLIDRSLFVSLPQIPEHQRRPEAELWTAFEAARPSILGAMLDAVSTGLKNLPQTKLDSLPRMADFAAFATAAEPSLGWQPGTFMAVYNGNRADANHLAIEASPIAAVISELASDGEWTGTATELLDELNRRSNHGSAPGQKRPPKHWPANGRALSGVLKRIAPNLRRIGVSVESWKDSDANRTKKWTVGTVKNFCVPCVQLRPELEKQAENSLTPWTQTDAKPIFRTQNSTTNPLHSTQSDAKVANLPHCSKCGIPYQERLKDGRIVTDCCKCGKYYGARPA